MVECQPDEGMMCWIRGTVVNIDLSQALYDVALESVRTKAATFLSSYNKKKNGYVCMYVRIM